MSEVLRGLGLFKTYDRDGDGLEVLKGVDFSLQAGEFASIMGVSGAGKSTLLHLLGALDRPSAGEVWIHGKRVNFLDDPSTSLLRNRHVGFVFQFHQLLPEFTAVENVALPLMISGNPYPEARSRAAKILESVGLRDRLHHLPSHLSGGEQQRVAVARALINQAGILLLDEPTGNLDRNTGESLFRLLQEIREERSLSVVMVTHNRELAIRAERKYRLEDGRIRPYEADEPDPSRRRT